MQETIDKLIVAIQERREVTFSYKDKHRVVQPCVCGLYAGNQKRDLKVIKLEAKVNPARYRKLKILQLAI